jgi:hypothetical protein
VRTYSCCIWPGDPAEALAPLQSLSVLGSSPDEAVRSSSSLRRRSHRNPETHGGHQDDGRTFPFDVLGAMPDLPHRQRLYTDAFEAGGRAHPMRVPPRRSSDLRLLALMADSVQEVNREIKAVPEAVQKSSSESGPNPPRSVEGVASFNDLTSTLGA